jgi:hypothetical protein
MLMNFTPDHGSIGGTHTNVMSYRSLRGRRTARRKQDLKTGEAKGLFHLMLNLICCSITLTKNGRPALLLVPHNHGVGLSEEISFRSLVRNSPGRRWISPCSHLEGTEC